MSGWLQIRNSIKENLWTEKKAIKSMTILTTCKLTKKHQTFLKETKWYESSKEEKGCSV